VALKVLSPQLSQPEGFLDRFRREAVVFSGLSHEHILPVYGFGERGGVTYIVTKLISSGTLADRLTQPLSFLWSAHYLDELASALDYAHGRGLIHRDVKPRNVLVDAGEWCYLADFGIAALAAAAGDAPSAPTVEHLPVGTPAYLAPERVRGEPPTQSGDTYSLAVVLFEMVTGRLPFQGETAWQTATAHAHGPIPSARRHNPDLPRAADLVLRRALAKMPEERFASAGELAAAWREALGLSQEDLDKMRREIDGRPAGQAEDRPHARETAVVDLPAPAEAPQPFEATEAVAPPTPAAGSPAAKAAPANRRVQIVLYAALGTLLIAAVVSFVIAFALR
jgi:serine/threonine-protein kinase